MDLALHLRRIPDNRRIPEITGCLSDGYDDDGCEAKRLAEMLPQVNRIYVGDEFCPMRMPSPAELTRFFRFAGDNNVGLTLLVPVLTDAWLDQSVKLFEILERWQPNADVVVNDIGTLCFLGKKHSGFYLSMGRLFNKGFKDPRLNINGMELSPHVRALLNESTFDGKLFQQVAARLNVKRLERDIMPHGESLYKRSSNYDTACYFPFGYVTTGRVCWTAAFGKNASPFFSMRTKCAKPCNTLSFWLKGDPTSPRLIQAGNTIFYIYPRERVSQLVEQAGTENFRLIYQGLAI